MDQSSRYADLSLTEAELIAGGKHILCAYRMKPKAGADPVDWAATHREYARAFESFPGDADAIFPGWRGRLLTA